MQLRSLLVDTHAHMPPAQVLEDLSEQDAMRRISNLAHSIGDIVAHVEFWQSLLLKRGGQPDLLEETIYPALEFPPLASYTVRDALVHVANHNSHHLGQIITLRQLMGAWPPPGGGWTW